MKSGVEKRSAYRVICLILMIILAILFTFPLYWIITGAFKTSQEIYATDPVWFPTEWVVNNFEKLFKYRSAPLFPGGPVVPAAIRWLINTVFMSVAAMLLTCITAAMAGYALAKKRFIGRGVVFALIICAMALPKQVILIPLLKEMSALHLYDTLWAVIFPTVGWPFGVFLMKQFSESIPGEMLEAARIDGASEARDLHPDRGAHGQAGHRRPGHLHLHQQLERLLHAVGHAGQQRQLHPPAGYRHPAGRSPRLIWAC